MKKLFVLTACFVLVSPAFVFAENACGCGEKDPRKGDAQRGAIVCPLYEVDTDYWYCDYYSPSCLDPPSAAYLAGTFGPVWECDPVLCENVARKPNARAADKREFKPDRLQKPIKKGPWAGLKPAPTMSDFLYRGKILYVRFPHPSNHLVTVVARVQQIEWSLATDPGGVAVTSPKRRLAALELAPGEAPEQEPISIEDFGYKTVVRLIKTEHSDPTYSVALDPIKQNPLAEQPAVLVWFRDGFPAKGK